LGGDDQIFGHSESLSILLEFANFRGVFIQHRAPLLPFSSEGLYVKPVSPILTFSTSSKVVRIEIPGLPCFTSALKTLKKGHAVRDHAVRDHASKIRLFFEERRDDPEDNRALLESSVENPMTISTGDLVYYEFLGKQGNISMRANDSIIHLLNEVRWKDLMAGMGSGLLASPAKNRI
jgi:hypothetical protein